MYAEFFGLQHDPFSIAPDPRYLFMSERHREALAHLLYGLSGGGGFVLLSGEIGTGKTTVCRCFLEQIPKDCNVAYIFNPKLTAMELLQSVCDEFHIPVAKPANGETLSIKAHVDALNAFLLASHAQGRNNVLIIDEAQNLSPDVLEQLRLLTNLETNERKLLQIILIGQPELRDLLAQPQLEQLAQRVIARFHLQALSEAETAHYIAHRLNVAGLARPLPFERKALRRIHQITRGVPRRINLLCNRALLGAFAWNQGVVDVRIVNQAASEVFDAGKLPPPAQRWWPSSRGRQAAAALGVLAVVASLAWAAGAAWQGRGSETAALTLGNRPAAAVSAAKPDLSTSPPPSKPVAGTAAIAVLAAPGSAAGSSAAAATSTAQSTTENVATSAPSTTATTLSQAPLAAEPPLLTAEQLQAALAGLPRFESDAWRNLAKGWQPEPALPANQPDPCSALLRQNLHCFKKSGSLALLRQLDRPGIVTLYDRRGAASHAVLTALSSQFATLDIAPPAAAPNLVRVSLDVLATAWRGEFATLWRAPAGYRLRNPEIGPALLQLAEQLARHYGTPPEPGPVFFNAALRAKLQAFQIEQELLPDGHAGPMTFMRLNRLTGVDEPRLLAAAPKP